MKEHIVLKTCRHLGNMKSERTNIGFSMIPYCTKQFECPDDIHKHLKCRNCPDFENYEYTIETN